MDVNEEQGHETVAQLKKEHGAKAIFVRADVSKASEVENVSSHPTAPPTHHCTLTQQPPQLTHPPRVCV